MLRCDSADSRMRSLYTPLLPQVTVGTISPRSIAQPTRHNTRYKTREVQVLEAEATKINAADKTVEFEDVSNIYGLNNGSVTTIPYDYLVVAVGSQVRRLRGFCIRA